MLAAALILPGCGDEDGPQVSIVSDTGPKGDPALLKGDPASGSQNQRVPITRPEASTAIYEAPVRELSDRMSLRAMASVTLTKCAITDYIPNNRANTACQGTREYTFDPVTIKTSFRLVGGGKRPDLDGPGMTLGRPDTYHCTTAVHHCTISQEAELELASADLRGKSGSDEYKWVVFEATATSPEARGCEPPSARGCNVLAVETQKGTAMYWVQADEGADETGSMPRDDTAETNTLKVLPNRSNKNKVRRVVYSVELTPDEQIDDLVGSQMEIAAKGRVRERLPQAPDIASYIVLGDSPTDIEGRFLISDTYNPDKTGNAGGNCDSRCEAEAAAAVVTILPCDVEAGRRYINVVSAASRAAARPGETVEILDGGFLKVTHEYASEANGNPAGESTSCER